MGIETILALPDIFRSERISALKSIPVGGETVFADIQGAGCIRHIWITCHDEQHGEKYYGREAVLRIYFDGSEVPQVEAPLEDFFLKHFPDKWQMGSSTQVPIQSRYVVVAPYNGYNCYFQMPFSHGARITISHDPAEEPHKDPGSAYMQVDWQRYKDCACPWRFHARWRRENPCEHYGQHFLMADIGGSPGYLLGCSAGILIKDNTDAWCHGGGDFMYLDGETAAPNHLHGIGMEDFFGASWGTRPFSALFTGSPFASGTDTGPGRVSFYRFFEDDLVRFEHSLHWMMGAMANDQSATAYWYQHGTAPRTFTMPPAPARVNLPGMLCPAGTYDIALWATGTWELIGPFHCPDRQTFQKPELPEENSAAALGKVCNFGGYARQIPPYTVKQVRRIARRHFVDFHTAFRPAIYAIALQNNVFAYATASFDLAKAGKVRLNFGADDWAKVWIDRQLALESWNEEGFKSHQINPSLAPGRHEVLVKLANFTNTNYKAWAFCLRVEAENGQVLL